MKKILNLIEIAVVVCILFFSFQTCEKKAECTNGKYYSADPSTVYFYPVCPECNHVSEMLEANVSEGESGTCVHSCEKCWHAYVIEIER